MVVKNITSTIKPEKTIAELERILVKFGAKAILKEYTGEQVTAISFYLESPTGAKIPFKLPMKVGKARAVVERAVDEKKLPLRFREEPDRTEKAMIVGWRIIKDVCHSHLSYTEIEFADPIELFLPFIWNPITEQTLYEQIKADNFKGMALEDKSGEVVER